MRTDWKLALCGQKRTWWATIRNLCWVCGLLVWATPGSAQTKPPNPKHSLGTNTPLYRRETLWLKTQQRLLQQRQRFQVLLQTDKATYRPGEVVWGRAVELWLRGHQLPGVEQRALIRCVDTKHRPLWQKTIQIQQGHSAFQWMLPQNLPRGWYRFQYINVMTKESGEYPIWVERGIAPKPRAKILFARSSFRPGQRVQAALTLRTPTGQRLRDQSLRLTVLWRGKKVQTWSNTTDQRGEIWVEFPWLKIWQDPTLSLVVSFRIRKQTYRQSFVVPVSSLYVKVQFFPEGGHAVVGLPSRIYLAARRMPEHTPINIVGVVEDGQGKTVTTVRTEKHGMGRFVYTPKAGTSYRLRIVQPWQHTRTFTLPPAKSDGITLRCPEHDSGHHHHISCWISSHTSRRVLVIARQQDNIVGQRAYLLRAGSQKLVLPITSQHRGVLRLTCFDSLQRPLAERLIFRHRKRGLRIALHTSRSVYALRQTMRIRIRVTDPHGRPVAHARLGVRVVEKHASQGTDPYRMSWLAQHYFSSKWLQGPIYRPNSYFQHTLPNTQTPVKSGTGTKLRTDARIGLDSALDSALDLVMGTHGWRPVGTKVREEPLSPFWNTGVLQIQQEAERKQLWPRITPPDHTTWPPETTLQTLKPLDVRATSQHGEKDTDGDGVPDDWDRCVHLPGSLHEQGCPWPDQDKDGIPDVVDACPYEPGPSWSDGCPKLSKVSGRPNPQRSNGTRNQQMKISLQIPFSLGSDRCSQAVQPQLQQLAQWMKLHPGLSVYVDGYAESQEPGQLLALAKKRAFAVRDRLVALGISEARLHTRARGILSASRRDKNLSHARVVLFRVKRWLQLPWWFRVEPPREFPVKLYTQAPHPTRTDWRETLYWHPHLVTNQTGEVSLTLGTGDRASVFRIVVDAVGKGHLGSQQRDIRVIQPIVVNASWPTTLAVGDKVVLPTTVTNYTSRPVMVRCQRRWSRAFAQNTDGATQEFSVPAGATQRREWLAQAQSVQSAQFSQTKARMEVICHSVYGKTRVVRDVQIRPSGFVYEKFGSGVLIPEQPYSLVFERPTHASRTQVSGFLAWMPNLASHLHCCGWPESSSICCVRPPMTDDKLPRYPFAIHAPFVGDFPGWIATQPKADAGEKARFLRHLHRRYRAWESLLTQPRLWRRYGQTQDSMVHIASILLWLVEMRQQVDIPPQLIHRVRSWLLSRRDGQGSFLRNTLGRYRQSPYALVAHAYLVYALAESGYKALASELRWLQTRIDIHRDPYLWSLALKAWIRVFGAQHPQAMKWTHLLWQHRQNHGGYYGTTTSASHATGQELHVQTTALAMQALVLSHIPPVVLQPTLSWLLAQRLNASFGSPLTTFLAQQAMVRYYQKTQPATAKGQIRVWLNQKAINTTDFHGGTRLPLFFPSWSSQTQQGANTLRMLLQADVALSFAFFFRYSSSSPPVPPPLFPVRVALSLSAKRVQRGATISLGVTITHTGAQPQKSVVLHLHLPAGMRVRAKALRQLVKNKQIDAFSEQAHVIRLFFRQLPKQKLTRFSLPCEAVYSGHFTSPASWIASHQNPRLQSFSAPLSVIVEP